MMESSYGEILISDIELDFDNPRIARLLARFKRKEDITPEAVYMALCPTGDSTFDALYESIKVNNGVIHPVILNRNGGKYTVIEGNTRVQIYKDLSRKNVPGEWTSIRSIIYDDLTSEQIHAIRLQSHLVGPRDWDPYSKAKYLTYLSNDEKMPMDRIISFVGGKASEVQKLIRAYEDMQQYYIPKIQTDIDHRKFSAFVELQNKGILESIIFGGYTKEDFVDWVINENIDKMANVRMLPAILSNDEATETFLKENATEAYKLITIPGLSGGLLTEATVDMLAYELLKKLNSISWKEVQELRKETSCEKKERLFAVVDAISDLKLNESNG